MGNKKTTKVLGLRDARRRIQQVIAILSERDPALLELWLVDGESRVVRKRPKPRR